jgi:uncharacterized protein YdaU (DUF1376 family)
MTDKRKPDDWMPLDVRKYLGDTMHLGREQHGAYLLLIMAYWMRGGALADSDQELGAIVRASQPDWRRLRPVMEPFFVVRDGKWVHRKVEKELARARELIAKKSKSGKAGAEARWGTDGERNADANGKRIADALPVPIAEPMPVQWQTDAPVPLPVPEEERKTISSRKRSSKTLVEPDSFSEFWQAYPDSRARQDAVKAYAQALSRGSQPDALLAGAKRYAVEVRGKEREFIKLAAGWIRGERWKDSETGQVIRPDAFHSSEEQEMQRRWKEKFGG